jgi:ribonuclease-3
MTVTNNIYNHRKYPVMCRRLIDLDDLHNLLGIDVDREYLPLYRQAFAHRSFDDEHNNERLEWIGDSVLSLVVSRYLYDTFPGVDEGVLTRYRVQLVSGKTLAVFSELLGLDRYVQMDEKGVENQFYKSSKVLEDVFESLVGCIYLCQGFIPARNFILRTINTSGVDIGALLTKEENFKDVCMRMQQRFGCDLPTYSLVSSSTIINDMGRKRTVFLMEAAVTLANGDSVSGYGEGFTKKDAEQQAAHHVVLAAKV